MLDKTSALVLKELEVLNKKLARHSKARMKIDQEISDLQNEYSTICRLNYESKYIKGGEQYGIPG